MALEVRCPYPGCSYRTNNVHSLFSHMLTTHCDAAGYFIEPGKETEETYYECQFCGATFKTYDKVVQHIINAHYTELQQLDQQLQAEEQNRRKGKRKSKKQAEETGSGPSP